MEIYLVNQGTLYIHNIVESKSLSVNPSEILIDFVNTITTNQKYLKALNDYETIARMIRFDQNGYKKSKLHELEKLLYDPQNYFHINRSSHNSDNLDFSSCLVALASPSIEGKTQSAFVFEDVRPLYFPLSIINDQTYKQPGKSEQSRSQNIYENDNSLTLAVYQWRYD